MTEAFYSGPYIHMEFSLTGYRSGAPVRFGAKIATPDGFILATPAAESFYAMQRDSGYIIRLNRAFDSMENHRRLYDAWKAGAKGAAPAATPGYSDHQMGIAIDIRKDNGGRSWVRAHGAKYGWTFPIAKEPWHAVWSA